MVEFGVEVQQGTRGSTRGSVIFRTVIVARGFKSREEASAVSKREDFASLSDRGGANIVELTPEFLKTVGKTTLEKGPTEGTTRTPEEQERVERKQKELTDINTQIERGGVSPQERQRLLQQRERVSSVPASQFTTERQTQTRKQPEVLTRTKLQREKAVAVQERARETRRSQLRAAGAEVIQKPSQRAFDVFATALQAPSTEGILPEPQLKAELERTKGFVTFKESEQFDEKERRKLTVSSFKPVIVKRKQQDKGIIPTADPGLFGAQSITAAPKPEGILERFSSNVARRREKLRRKREEGKASPEEILIGGAEVIISLGRFGKQ